MFVINNKRFAVHLTEVFAIKNREKEVAIVFSEWLIGSSTPTDAAVKKTKRKKESTKESTEE